MPDFPLPEIESAPRKAVDEAELEKEEYQTPDSVSGTKPGGELGALVDLEPVRKSLDLRLSEFNKTFAILGGIGLGLWFLKEFGPGILKAIE